MQKIQQNSSKSNFLKCIKIIHYKQVGFFYKADKTFKNWLIWSRLEHQQAKEKNHIISINA